MKFLIKSTVLVLMTAASFASTVAQDGSYRQSKQDMLNITTLRSMLTQDEQLDTLYYEELQNKKERACSLAENKSIVKKIKEIIALESEAEQEKKEAIVKQLKSKTLELQNMSKDFFLECTQLIDQKDFSGLEAKIASEIEVKQTDGVTLLAQEVKKWEGAEKFCDITAGITAGIAIILPVISIAFKNPDWLPTAFNIATSVCGTIATVTAKASLGCGKRADTRKKVLICAMNAHQPTRIISQQKDLIPGLTPKLNQSGLKEE